MAQEPDRFIQYVTTHVPPPAPFESGPLLIRPVFLNGYQSPVFQSQAGRSVTGGFPRLNQTNSVVCWQICEFIYRHSPQVPGSCGNWHTFAAHLYPHAHFSRTNPRFEPQVCHSRTGLRQQREQGIMYHTEGRLDTKWGGGRRRDIRSSDVGHVHRKISKFECAYVQNENKKIAGLRAF